MGLRERGRVFDGIDRMEGTEGRVVRYLSVRGHDPEGHKTHSIRISGHVPRVPQAGRPCHVMKD